MIAQIALKAKQDYDKTGERAMNHIEKAYKQQTEERQSNSGWTGNGGASHAQPQQQAPVVINMKKDKEDEDEKNEEETKPHTAGEGNSEGVNENDQQSGGVIENLVGGNGGNDVSGKTGGSWIEDVLNTVGTK